MSSPLSIYHYKTIEVPVGKTITYQFPNGSSAHWVRFVPDIAYNATAILRTNN